MGRVLVLWGATDNENKGPRVSVHFYTPAVVLAFLPEALSWRKVSGGVRTH